MDDEALGRVHDRAIRHARRFAIGDPAVEPADLVAQAWVKVLPILGGLAGELDCLRLLMQATNQAAIDCHRKAARRPRGAFGAWLPSGQDVAAEALARVELTALLASGAGAVYAVMIAAGWSRREVGAACGLAAATINGARWRWRKGLEA